MKHNISIEDRIVRFFIALAILILYMMGYLPGTVGIVFITVSIILALTSFINFCPLYAIFKVKRWEKDSTK